MALPMVENLPVISYAVKLPGLILLDYVTASLGLLQRHACVVDVTAGLILVPGLTAVNGTVRNIIVC